MSIWSNKGISFSFSLFKEKIYEFPTFYIFIFIFVPSKSLIVLLLLFVVVCQRKRNNNVSDKVSHKLDASLKCNLQLQIDHMYLELQHPIAWALTSTKLVRYLTWSLTCCVRIGQMQAGKEKVDTQQKWITWVRHPRLTYHRWSASSRLEILSMLKYDWDISKRHDKKQKNIELHLAKLYSLWYEQPKEATSESIFLHIPMRRDIKRYVLTAIK